MNGNTRSCGCLFQESRKECVSHRRDIEDKTCLSSLVASKTLRRDNQSGCTGVYLDHQTGKWAAQIVFQKKRYRLGSYTDKNEAIRARKEAEKRFHDPLILEKWNCLTEKSKEKFIHYCRFPEGEGK